MTVALAFFTDDEIVVCGDGDVITEGKMLRGSIFTGLGRETF
ncbi:hypothetical protein [Arthrobacter sp. R3-55]